MNLAEIRNSIRPLLNDRLVADASAVYYAFYHPQDKIRLVTASNEAGMVSGYLCIARTGIDLFRPLVTMRLPLLLDSSEFDLEESMALINKALPEGANVILNAPLSYLPLLSAAFFVQSEQMVKLFRLEPDRYQPIVNVLVTESAAPNKLPRYTIRQPRSGQATASGEILASAGINWQSDQFADIYVHTKSSHRQRGFGRSVVSRLVQDILASGRIPIYAVNKDNQPSIKLAESVGFVESGVNEIIIDGIRKSTS